MFFEKHNGHARALAVLASGLLSFAACAQDAPADPALEAHTQAIARELRCLVCQNQTLAESSSDLAQDLRRQVREMLRRGDSEQQVLAYMTERYGDFVLYRPRLGPRTVLLWAGPALLLTAGAATLWGVLRRRERLGDEAFESEADDDAEAVDEARTTTEGAPR